MSKSAKRVDWHYHINRYESEFGELTCSAYCIQEGISRSSFSKYRKELKSGVKPRGANPARTYPSSSPTKFIAIEPPKTPSGELLISYRIKILGIPVLKVERYV